jgi:hypothetical protein
LFSYEDLGAVGVGRWLRLRTDFARAIEPLIGLCDSPSAPLESRVVTSGIALEALGYELTARSSGRGSQISFREALRTVFADLPLNAGLNREEWIERSRACFMGAKHADNEQPELLAMANTMRENLLILRLWIAGRLGVPPSVLERRLPTDPHIQPYTATS